MLRIVAITGAGLSVASGIRPYRGEDGVYTEMEQKYGMPIEQLITFQSFWKDPDRFWEYWSSLANSAQHAVPNAAHDSLVSISKTVRFTEVTQNVDGLSLAAGMDPTCLIELHGDARSYTCTRCGASHEVDVHLGMETPRCDKCNKPEHAPIRPNVVMFNESIKAAHYNEMMYEVKTANILLLVGTTLQFGYLGDMVMAAMDHATIIHIDPNPDPDMANVADFTLSSTAVDGLAIIESCIVDSSTTLDQFNKSLKEKLA